MNDGDADNSILRHLRVLDDAAAERLEKRVEAVIRRAAESSAQAREDASMLEREIAKAMRARLELDERLKIGARLLRAMDATPRSGHASAAARLDALEGRLKNLESSVRTDARDATLDGDQLVRIVEDAERNVAVMLARAAELRMDQVGTKRGVRDDEADSAAERANDLTPTEVEPEVHSMVGALGNLVGLLFETELSERQREYLIAARRSIDAIQQMVAVDEDRTGVDRARRGGETFDLRQRIRDVLRQFDETAADSDVDIRLTFDDAVPTSLCGDLGRFRQALYFIVARALQLAEPGDLALAVRPQADVTSDAVLRFTLRQERANAAVRARSTPPTEDSRRAAVDDAAGFGLYIARQLVEAMGGELGAHEHGDTGFELWFTARFVNEVETDNDGRGCPRLRQEGLRCNYGEVVDLSRAGMRVRGGRSASGVVDVTIGEGEERLELRAEVMAHRRLGLLRHELELRFLDVTAQLAARLGRMCTNHRHVPGLGGH